MNEDDVKREKALEGNIDQLLSRTEPELQFPQEARQRVLDALKRDAEPRKRSRRTIAWATGAAAALIFSLFAFWPGGGQHGVAWADVKHQLDEASSFTAWGEFESLNPSGERRTTLARIYQKNPALTRTEFLVPAAGFPPPGGEIDPQSVASVQITIGGQESSTVLRLDPRERVARRTTLTFSGEALRSRGALPRNLVSGVWSRLHYLSSDQTRSIGWREINGRPVVGFEAEIREMVGAPDAGPVDGWLRLWADEKSGVPVRVELEFTDPQGAAYRSTFTELEWNVELPDDLFAVPEDGDWSVVDDEVRLDAPGPRRLRPDVTLRVHTTAGAPLLSEADIVAADLDASGLTLSLRLSPEAGRRLHDYTAKHLGERVTIDFNGETEIEVTIAGEIGRSLRIDLAGLDLSPQRFRERYLTLPE